MTRDIAREPCLVHRDPERRVSHVQDHRRHRSRQRLPRSTCPEARCNDLGIFPAPQGRGTGAPENHVIVLFGATGDLARRKLLPGLFRLAAADVMPGSASAVKAVSVIRTGAVQIHPRAALRHPQAAVLVAADLPAVDTTTADQRLRHRARQEADPVRHRARPRLSHRRELLPRRLHRLPLRPARPLRYHRVRHPERAQLGYAPADVSTAIVSHPHEDHIGGLPELAGANLLVSAAEWAELSRPAQNCAASCPGTSSFPACAGIMSAPTGPRTPRWRPSPSRWI
jgi:Metallo-beta-lactamase superfamily/Glucose-6-phosphate dehydrogenase, NAD binding domain